jgi:hypothetical protein
VTKWDGSVVDCIYDAITECEVGIERERVMARAYDIACGYIAQQLLLNVEV